MGAPSEENQKKKFDVRSLGNGRKSKKKKKKRRKKTKKIVAYVFFNCCL